MITLHTQPRAPKGKLEQARTNGLVPAVIYGDKVTNQSVFVDRISFQKAFKEAGESAVVTLLVGDTQIPVLIHDIAHSPVTKAPIHIDFVAVDLSREIHAVVPLVFVGESEAAQALNATVTKLLHEIQVIGMSDALPHSLSVDVASLVSLESHILVGDLVLPQGVSLYHTDKNDIVANLSLQKEAPLEASANSTEAAA